MDGSDRARLAAQQSKIDNAVNEFRRILVLSVTEQRHGEISVNVPVKAGLLDVGVFLPAYSLKL